MRALSLKAYKALSRGQSDAKPAAKRAKRPAGTVVWVVVHDDAELRAMIYLHERLVQSRGPSTLLLTAPQDAPVTPPKGFLFEELTSDQLGYVRSFLSDWQPDICIWLTGDTRSTLIAEAKFRGVLLFMLGAQSDRLDQNTWRWVPGMARDVLLAFHHITATNAETERHLRRVMPHHANIRLSAPLQIATPPPPVSQDHFQELSEMLGGRSVWLAARVQADELSDVLAAHKSAVRLTHRLLLVLVCADVSVATTAREMLSGDSWRVSFWDDGDIIDEATQIVLVQTPDDIGLWLRAAPVSFLGSSIRPGHGGCDPYEAAALGSAIIYGPNVRAHLASYSRLAAAGAARIVSDAQGLARALSHLLAIDQAASMAHSAWQVVSSGAQATDAVVQQIQDLMDARDGGNPDDARP